ncbi:MAG: hypothetical protein KC443_12990, partial [Anaerolineales bacterium]|nr:hypothetical protein [Anaerolineales bacterium]
MTPIELHQALVIHFNEGELQTLCLALNVDYESLPAVGKENKARELLLLLARGGRIAALLQLLAQMRPHVAWPLATEAVALTQAMQPELGPVSATAVSQPQPMLSIGGSVTGPVSTGNMTINAPVAGRDLTINTATPRWQRWLLLALLPLLLLVLLGVMVLLRPLLTPNAQAPNPDQLLPVAATLAPHLAVTAMTLAQSDAGEVLWFGAWQEGQAALYQLDVAARETAVPQLALTTTTQINQIMVDCRQNVWLALDETGVLVYQPTTGRQDTLLSKTTLPGLPYNTMAALAHRCLETGEVEVWLGRAGVQTVRYQSDYPTQDTLDLLAADTDFVFAASQGIEVTDLLFVPQTAVLWVSGQRGELLSISTRQVRPPQLTRYEEDTLWSLSLAADGTVWAGSSHHLIHDGSLLALQDAAGRIPNSRARQLAAGARWVWFGDFCPEMASDCWALGAYQNGRFFPVDLGTRRQVNGLVID